MIDSRDQKRDFEGDLCFHLEPQLVFVNVFSLLNSQGVSFGPFPSGKLQTEIRID